jgi:hypothetical protein
MAAGFLRLWAFMAVTLRPAESSQIENEAPFWEPCARMIARCLEERALRRHAECRMEAKTALSWQFVLPQKQNLLSKRAMAL